MKEHVDRMDNAIKDKFEGHEVPVPSHLWSSIESKLPSPNRENGNGANYFFNNPFILSILVISTSIIGTYIYNRNNTESNHKTNTTTEVSSSHDVTNSLPVYSTHTFINKTEKEKNQTAAEASSIYSTNTFSNSLSKNQGETTMDMHVSNKSTSKKSVDSKQTKLNDSYANKILLNQNNQHIETSANNSITNTNSIKTPVSTSTNKSSKSASNSHADETLSDRVNKHSNKTTASASLNSFTNSTANAQSGTASSIQSGSQSNSANGTSIANSSNSTNTHTSNTNSLSNTQSSNNNTANTTSAATHIDSIKVFTSVFMDKNNIADNNDLVSNTGTTSNVPMNTNLAGTNASATNQDLNATQISGSLVSINSTNALSTASDAASLYSLNNTVNRSDAFSLIDQAFTFNANITPAHELSLDTSTNKENKENSFYSNSGTSNDTIFANSQNSTTKEIFAKVDSTIIAKKIDSVTTEHVAKTIDKTTTEEKKSLFLSRCSLDGYITPAFGNIHLSPNDQESASVEYTKLRNKNTNTGLGITSGLRINYALTQKIEIGIGLQYSSLSQHSSYAQQKIDSVYNTYQGYNRIDSTYDTISHQVVYTHHYIITDTTSVTALSNQVKKYTDKFQNISIPIHIAYGYSISNKLSLLARTSMLINYQTYSVTYFMASDSSIVGYYSNKNISFGGSFSIGGYYQFSKRCSVFAEPIISYYFSNVFDRQAPFKQTQFMLGLQTGIRFSF